MIYTAPSHPPQMSGLSQPPMAECTMFGVNPIPVRFGPHKPVLVAGEHKPLTGGDHAPLDAPTVGTLLDVYGR